MVAALAPGPASPGVSQAPGWTSGSGAGESRGDVADLHSVNFQQSQLSAPTCASSAGENDANENDLCSSLENLDRGAMAPQSMCADAHV